MPLIEESTLNGTQLIQDLNTDNSAAMGVPRDPTFLETLGAAFRTHDLLSSISYKTRFSTDTNAPFDPSFNAHLENKGTIYENFPAAFDDVGNESQMRSIRHRIDAQLYDQKLLENSGLLGDVISLFATAISLPNVFLPVKFAKLGTALTAGMASTGVARGAIIGGISMGGTAALREAGFNYTSDIRTPEDAYITTGIETALGAMLGGGIAGLSKIKRDRKIKSLMRTWEQRYQEEAFAAENMASQVAREMHGIAPELAAAEEAVVSEALSAESALHATDVFKRMNPNYLLAQSESAEARTLAQQLMLGDYLFNNNAAFYGTAGSIERGLTKYSVFQRMGADNLRNQFENYFIRASNEFLSNGIRPMSARQFEEAVGLALLNGGASDIAEVAAAADFYNKNVFGVITDAAKGAGLNRDVRLPRAAPGFFPLLLDPGAVSAGREALKNKIREFIPAALSRAAGRKSMFTRLVAKLKADKEAVIGDSAEAIAKRKGYDKQIADFERRIKSYGKVEAPISETTAVEMAEEIIDYLQGIQGGLALNPRIPLSQGPLQSVKLDFIPREALLEWSNMRVSDVVDAYIKAVAPEIELANSFGEATLKKQLDKVRKQYTTAIEGATTPKAKAALESQMNRDLRDIKTLIERTRGTTGQAGTADNIIRNGENVLRMPNLFTKIENAALETANDFGEIVGVEGLNNAFGDAVSPLMRELKAIKVTPKEAETLHALWEVVLNNNKPMNVGEVFESVARNNKIKSGLSAVDDAYSVSSVISSADKMQREMATVLSQSEVMNSVERFMAGKLNAADVETLASAGIDQATAKRIGAMLQKHSSVGESGVRMANTHLWEDIALADRFEAGTARYARSIRSAMEEQARMASESAGVEEVISPQTKKLPQIVKTAIKMMLGFNYFSKASAQKVLTTALETPTKANLASLSGKLAGGMVMYAAKQWITGRALSTSPTVWLTQGLIFAGVLNALSSVNIRAAAIAGGKVFENMVFGSPMFYQTRMPEKALAELLGSRGKAVRTLVDMQRILDEHDQRNSYYPAMYRDSAIPEAHVRALRQLLEEANRGINSTIGVN